MTEPPRRSLRSSALSPHNPQAPASVGSQRPQPHLKDSSVYRQNRPTRLDKIKNFRLDAPVDPVSCERSHRMALSLNGAALYR